MAGRQAPPAAVRGEVAIRAVVDAGHASGEGLSIWSRVLEVQHKEGRGVAHVGVKRRVADTECVLWRVHERQSRRKSAKCPAQAHAYMPHEARRRRAEGAGRGRG